VTTQEPFSLTAEHRDAPATPRAPKPGSLAPIVARCPVQRDDLAYGLPVPTADPVAIRQHHVFRLQSEQERANLLLSARPGHPMGPAIEVSLPMELSHIKSVDFLQRGACALPAVPLPRARATHTPHSCQFLVEIIREIAPLITLLNACSPSNNTAQCPEHSIVDFSLFFRASWILTRP
jgi:hypothetical protein